MSLLGIHLTLLIGPTIPRPAPIELMEAIESVEVTHNDKDRSGFQIVFRIGRSGTSGQIDYPLLRNQLLAPCNRVILIVIFNATPRVLMDGIITNQQLQPGAEPGQSTLTITGEDISILMDMREKSVEHIGENEMVIARTIITEYSRYGIFPDIRNPQRIDTPNPQERIPVQQGTDLQYLKEIAERFSFAFYIAPGPITLKNTAYWGPKIRTDLLQRPLSVNLGPDSNVLSINFQNNALAPTTVSGNIQDRNSNENIRVETSESTRPAMASNPALVRQACIRQRIFRADSDFSATQAEARAQAITDDSMDVITAQGELDAIRYNDILQARGKVELRGAGFNYNGEYYVESVTHKISAGDYKQQFTMKREGTGSIIGRVSLAS